MTRRLAVTMGDPRGIGPEIVARAVARGHGRGVIVCGDADLLAATARKLHLPHGAAEVFHVPAREADGGVAFVAAAHELAMHGEVAGIVTGPIRKLAPFRHGGAAPGHTELLSEWSGVRPTATML
ncbi:MAG TPA: 4-hydroxythreonine-4-phosphate dehydrogenase PdxA, partial [bacterium]|nr:4-hydroxythreonine-4-phosphate dehydrogenase PdxA [bacterium]